MRIAYVINSVEGGGAALPVPSIVDVLTRAGADVRVLALTRRDGRALGAMAAAGIDVEVRDGGETDHWSALRWLGDSIGAMHASHIWTSLSRATLLGQIAGQRLGLPVISWQHAAYLKPANRVLLRLRQRRSALWIADSESVAMLTAKRLNVPPDRLVTWPIFAADAGAPQATAWQPGQTIRLGSLGRLHPVKGYDVLVRALGLLKADGFAAPFDVSIAGDGAEAQTLSALAQELGVGNLRLSGYVDNPKTYLAGLHLYLQPSRSEGFCVAAHEAMQAGLPMIASAVGEIPFTLASGGGGTVVPPGDPVALAAALRSCLSAPEALHAAGQSARARVLERFSRARFENTGFEIVARIARG